VLLAALAVASSGIAPEDRFASDPDLRRFVDAIRGETIALDLGRLVYRKRWEEVLTEALYLVAPRGAWDEAHPAWPAARQAMADALRRESLAQLTDVRGSIRAVVHEQSLRLLTAEERRQAALFFESPGGRVWRAARETAMHERAFGLPYLIEPEPLAELTRAKTEARRALDKLPEDAEGKVVGDFFGSPLGDKIMKLQNEEWAHTVANVLGGGLEAIAIDKRSALAAAVRAASPGVPPASDKAYLGTVRMDADRAFAVTVEHRRSLRLVGTYTLTYRAGELHWADIASAVPDMKPGETRAIYRDPRGRLGDKP
jgi:hypothetical protein